MTSRSEANTYRVRTRLAARGQLCAMSLSREEGALVLVRVRVRVRVLVVARHYLYRATPELLPGALLVIGAGEGREEEDLVLVHGRAHVLGIRFRNVGPASLRQGVSSWRGVCAPSTTFPSSPFPSTLVLVSPRFQRRCIESPRPTLSSTIIYFAARRFSGGAESRVTNDDDDDEDCAAAAARLT